MATSMGRPAPTPPTPPWKVPPAVSSFSSSMSVFPPSSSISPSCSPLMYKFSTQRPALFIPQYPGTPGCVNTKALGSLVPALPPLLVRRRCPRPGWSTAAAELEGVTRITMSRSPPSHAPGSSSTFCPQRPLLFPCPVIAKAVHRPRSMVVAAVIVAAASCSRYSSSSLSSAPSSSAQKSSAPHAAICCSKSVPRKRRSSRLAPSTTMPCSSPHDTGACFCHASLAPSARRCQCAMPFGLYNARRFSRIMAASSPISFHRQIPRSTGVPRMLTTRRLPSSVLGVCRAWLDTPGKNRAEASNRVRCIRRLEQSCLKYEVLVPNKS
mmetsp:Transcript_21442/g.43988  ORF Transcript_21442/g.43988 Transcript_21442/m.43988 type:complete len:324 (-) Transcript_21442:62-1033(-)